MISMKIRLAILAGATLALGAIATSASAGTGCNGHVEQQTWGCAAWDNNNGPQFKYWKGAPAKAAPAPSYISPSLANKAGPLIAGNGNGLVASGGGNLAGNGLVASGGGNLVASGGGNLVASGGGNLKGK